MRAWLRWLYTLEVPRLGGRPVQAGALCWRKGESGIELLLVTSRRSGRWGLPKGWALRGRPLHRTAEREAWEEAGAVGRCDNRLLGLVDAPKRYRLVGRVDWTLALYPLHVERLAEEWPERAQRERRWFGPEEAAERVRPRSLQPLLAGFRPISSSEERGPPR
jgi:8-oxo-dGTP pyrophosphatase MutT (NUDIX family)